MKTNYNKIMEDIISSLDYKPKLLLHACCGICSASVVERLYDYFDITILYYNPNTYPYSEYKKRYETLLEMLEKTNKHVKVMEIGYNEEEFNNKIKGLEGEKEGGKRCLVCYELRLRKTAEIAKENNFDYFTTTLSVSPYKRSDILNNIGDKLSKEYNVKYLYSDFKKKNGFKRSNEISYKYNLYRQNYCGCKYSKR